MKNIIVKIGDNVKLFNGTEGIINDGCCSYTLLGTVYYGKSY